MYEQERQAIVDYAKTQIGAAKSDHTRVQAYWADCLQGGLPPKGYIKSWCGGFVLHCLRKVLGISDQWRDGKGFLYQSVTKGKTVPLKSAKPGDVVYYPHKNQHYALVAEVRSDGLVTIDGNSNNAEGVRGVWLHTKPWASLQGAVCFTIEPFLLDQAKTNPCNPKVKK